MSAQNTRALQRADVSQHRCAKPSAAIGFGTLMVVFFFGVLPGLAWVHIKAAAKEGGGDLEMSAIAVAAGTALDGHEPAVDGIANAQAEQVRLLSSRRLSACAT
ncbi:MAG: hypothetical protein ABIW82_09215 [Dokdonella sp.]